MEGAGDQSGVVGEDVSGGVAGEGLDEMMRTTGTQTSTPASALSNCNSASTQQTWTTAAGRLIG